MAKEQNLRCSFCGKSQEEVEKIIAGPTVYICDECIDLCNDIIEEERAKELGEPVKNNVPVKILKEAKKLAKIASEMESRAVLENRSIKKRYSGMF